MSIITCASCGTKNRVDERAAISQQAVCGRCGAALNAGAGEAQTGKPEILTDAIFDRAVLQAEGPPVLVDFWAEWCGPCRMIAPALEQLAAESQGRYRVAKLNIDENPHTPSRYGIRSIPTLIIFRNGAPVDRIVGALPKQAIAARLAQYIKDAR